MPDRSSVIFNQINIVSADTGASLQFYRSLGMDIPDSAIWKTESGLHHITAQKVAGVSEACFDIDSAAFAGHWNEAWKGSDEPPVRRVVIGFAVESRERVDTLYEEMTAAGYRGLQPPHDAIWGARYAVIEDPDGIAVGIMSPTSPELTSPPPAI